MASDRLAPAALLAAALAGCGFDAEPVVEEVAARVGDRVDLTATGAEAAIGDDATWDWRLDQRPDDSQASLMNESAAHVLLDVDRVGAYVVDRWERLGASESWTHRFYVDAHTSPPNARLTGPTSAAAGDAITIDGSPSSDPDGSPLTFQWRLASRPRNSTAELDDAQASAVTLALDQRGSYTVELSVFDGELWSESAATLAITAD